jgi:hypothetical protein
MWVFFSFAIGYKVEEKLSMGNIPCGAAAFAVLNNTVGPDPSVFNFLLDKRSRIIYI